MTDRELMQMALDALGTASGFITKKWQEDAWKVQNLLSDRLAQPEPVHAIDISQERVDETAKDRHDWVGFTAAERDEIVPMLVQSLINHDDKTMTVLLRAILIDVEAKLKEKNT